MSEEGVEGRAEDTPLWCPHIQNQGGLSVIPQWKRCDPSAVSMVYVGLFW